MNPSFDLEKSIAAWRAEFSASNSLREGSLAELETHLRSAFAELGARGLADDEAFHLARRRLGGAELAEEFAKVHLNAVWADRAKWMLFGMLGYAVCWSALHLFGSILQIWVAHLDLGQAGFVADCLLITFGTLGLFGYVLVRLVRGKWRIGGVEQLAVLRHPAMLAGLVGVLFFVEKATLAVRFTLLRSTMDSSTMGSYGSDSRLMISQFLDTGLAFATLLAIAVAAALANRWSRRIA